MKPLISESLVEVLLNQWTHERYNASLYLYIASFLEGKGLSNLALLFRSQHDEEIGHSKMIFDLLSDLNVVINIPLIEGCNMPINSIIDIAELYFSREVLTTESLTEIRNMAMEENSGIVEEKMREMISLQQHEMAESTEFLDRANLTAGNWQFVLLWDSSLGK